MSHSATIQTSNISTQDVFRMVEAGALRPDEKVELIYGELRRLSPKHYRHERVKMGMNRILARALPDTLSLGVETTLYLRDTLFLEPDLHIFPADYPSDEVPPHEIALAVEVVDSTLDYDLRVKAPIYARHGVQMLWVIDAVRDVTHVHRIPTEQGYGDIVAHDAETTLPTSFTPGLDVRLSDLPTARSRTS